MLCIIRRVTPIIEYSYYLTIHRALWRAGPQRAVLTWAQENSLTYRWRTPDTGRMFGLRIAVESGV